MKQLLQRLDTGATELSDVPVPQAGDGTIVVRTAATVISVGTERMLVEFGRAGLLEKARKQPDRVRQAVDKARTEGVLSTIDAVRSKLATPFPLGYCNAGIVVEAGPGAGGLRPGDRVVTNGPHSEYVRVAHTLAARIPGGVGFENAAFTPLAAIALQGQRLAEPTLGETFVVYGLGLIGLLAVQLLRANGCRVLGIDTDETRLALAEETGAASIDATREDIVARVMALTRDRGADGVLLTLASSSHEPVHLAAEMSRKRGRLVLVGVTGLGLRREDFYQKELSFAVSCSYGPGRYDPAYEQAGQDYPLGFVRWTEQRNFEAVLELMAAGRLDPRPLITHRIPFDEAPAGYDMITAGDEATLGVVLQYPPLRGAESESADRPVRPAQRRVAVAPPRATGDRPSIAVIGAGNFALRTLLPALEGLELLRAAIASSSGTGAAVAARKFGFERAETDVDGLLTDDAIDAVLILTRHDSHAELARRALEAGKHVFVEKPLALTAAQLDEVAAAARAAERVLMVGFNRRFAPLTADAAARFQDRVGPLTVIASVNAGRIPRDHWVQDAGIGGGRIIGEAVHWIDLSRRLVGAPIESLQVTAAHDRDGAPIDDIAHLSLGFQDGSTAAIHYVASGSARYPKERIECHADGRSLVIDNWRRLKGYGMPGTRGRPLRGPEKGHRAELVAWLHAVRTGADAPIPLDEILEVSAWAIRAGEEARSQTHPDAGSRPTVDRE